MKYMYKNSKNQNLNKFIQRKNRHGMLGILPSKRIHNTVYRWSIL